MLIAKTSQKISLPFTEIQGDLEKGNSPIGHYYALKGWIGLFGSSEFAVHTLSGLFFILNLLVIFYVGKQWDGQDATGWLASFLYMLSPTAVYHSQNARPYALLALLCSISTLLFIKIFIRGKISKKYLIAYLLTLAAGLLTHYWYCFVFASHAVALVMLTPKKRWMIFAVLAVMAIFIFCFFGLDLFLVQGSHKGVTWMTAPNLRTFLATYSNYTYKWPYLLIITAAAIGLGCLKKTGDQGGWTWNSESLADKKLFLFFVIQLLGLTALPALVSQAYPVYVVGRYTILGLLPFVLLFVVLLRRSSNKKLLALFLIIVFAMGCGSAIKEGFEPVYNDRKTAAYLLENADDGDVLLFTSLSRSTMEYYLDRSKSSKKFHKFTFPEHLDQHPAWRSRAELQDPLYVEKCRIEADALMSRVKVLMKNSKKKLWLFYGKDLSVSSLIKARLDREYMLEEKLDLRSTPTAIKYDQILRYGQTRK